jgi:RNA polymerase sigma-70 factor (ECF subfamily)
MNDATVIDKILKGDSSYFEVLVLKYQNKLYATILNITKNSHTAEDIVQEAFLKSFQKLSSLREKNQFYPWLKRIAINMALLMFEKNKRQVDVTTDDDSYDFFDNISTKESPESEILNEELKKYVRKYIDSLPDKLRMVIILREVEDLSYEEISKILKIPVGTVRSRLFNARQFIKQRLINQGLADGLYKIS